MDALSWFFKSSTLFALKILIYGFIAIVAILFVRIGYCYLAADSSATNIIPQVARYVSEDNGLVTDVAIDGSYTSFDKVVEIFNNANTVTDARTGVTRNNAAFHYYVPTKTQFTSNSIYVSGKKPAVQVYRVSGGTVNTSYNVCLQNVPTSVTSSTGKYVAQRGDVLEVRVTVYATVTSGIKFKGRSFGNISIPITKTMRIPSVKYYRGLS